MIRKDGRGILGAVIVTRLMSNRRIRRGERDAGGSGRALLDDASCAATVEASSHKIFVTPLNREHLFTY
jgi:hypothetical protein